MRMGTVCRIGFVVVGVVAGLILLSQSERILADESNSPWFAPINMQVGRDATREDATTLRDCYNMPIQTLSYTDNQNKPSKTPRLVTIDNCEVAGIGQYIRAGYGYKQMGYQRVNGIPGSDQTLVSYSKGSGRAFAIARPPSAIGKFTAANSSNPLEGTFEVDDLGLPYIKNDKGQAVEFNPNSYNFSPNGQYIVAEAMYAGFVRINTENGQVTLFSSQYYTYGMGYDPTPIFAISNDGNTVVVSNFEGGPLYIYDLSTCTTHQIKAYNNVASGCKAPKDIRPDIKQQFPDYWRTYGMQFSGDDKSLRAVVSEKNPGTNKITSKVATINQQGHQPQPVDYIAMGDSFASGEGDMDSSWYEAGTDVHGVNMCHLSKRSYPYLLNSTLSLSSFHSVTCSGAITDNIDKKLLQHEGSSGKILGEWHPGTKQQIEFIDKSSPPSFITLSIGGNDLKFSDILTDCVLPADDGSCKYVRNAKERADTAKRIAKLHQTLTTTYKEIKKTTNRETKIYVVGYPQFISPEGTNCGRNVNLDASEREYINKSVSYANRVIKSAVKEAGVYYLDIEDTLNATSLCSGALDRDMSVNGLTVGNDKPGVHLKVSRWEGNLGMFGNESYHPNQNGHALIKSRILQLTNGNPAEFQTCENGSPVCEDVKQKIPLPDASYFGDDAYKYVQYMNQDSPNPVSHPGEVTKAIGVKNIAGRLINIGSKALTFTPEGRVTVWLHSTPIKLGETVATQDGSIDTQVVLPENVLPGLHEIHFKGKNLANEEIDYYLSIFIPSEDGDTNKNGIKDSDEPCGIIQNAGVDYDRDGVDDACDGQIGEPPAPEEPEQPTPPENPQDTKTPLGESVAGREVLISTVTPSAETSASTELSTAVVAPTPRTSISSPPQATAPVLGSSTGVSVATSQETTKPTASTSAQAKGTSLSFVILVFLALGAFGLAGYTFVKVKAGQSS